MAANARRWTFTLHTGLLAADWELLAEFMDPVEGYLDFHTKPRVSGAVWQLEECPTTGQLHFQGYIEYDRNVRLAQAKREASIFFDGAHMEPARGTRTENVDYCSKDDTRVAGPWYYPSQDFFDGPGQGRRSDLKTFADRIKNGEKLEVVATDMPGTYLQYSRGAKDLANMVMKPRFLQEAPIIEVHFGRAGSGKTKYMWDQVMELSNGSMSTDFYYLKEGSHKWFDGYKGQACILMDDFGEDGAEPGLRLDALLRLWDRYPFQGEIKGGMVEIQASRFIITSNFHPRDWYKRLTLDRKRALARRITKLVRYTKEDGVYKSTIIRWECEGDQDYDMDPALEAARTDAARFM